MSLKSSLLIFCVMIITCSFSQENTYPVVSKIENDSVIIFTLKQGKELIVINEERKECKEINDVLNKEIVQKDTIIYSQQKKIDNYEQIIVEKDNIIARKEELNGICEQEKSMLKKEVRKHKVGKWFALAGCVAIGVLGIVF